MTEFVGKCALCRAETPIDGLYFGKIEYGERKLGAYCKVCIGRWGISPAPLRSGLVLVK